MAEYTLNNCTNLVSVAAPFGDLSEILDMDMDLGPHLDAFEIFPNFGLGEIAQASPPVMQHSSVQFFSPQPASQTASSLPFPFSSFQLGQEPLLYEPVLHNSYKDDAMILAAHHWHLSPAWLNSEFQGMDDFLLSPADKASRFNKGISIQEPAVSGIVSHVGISSVLDKGKMVIDGPNPVNHPLSSSTELAGPSTIYAPPTIDDDVIIIED